MVSWTQDGKVSGYSPSNREFTEGVFFLASPGAVDVNGVTRLQRYLAPQQIDPLNKIRVTVTWSISNGDLATPGVAQLGPMLVMAQDNSFPSGHIPTIAEIVAASFWSYWPAGYVNSPQTKTWTIDGLGPTPGLQIQPNTKMWVAVVPATRDYVGNNPTVVEPWLETVGRAISVWSNRTPAKPTITSPVTGATVTPGGVVQFTYDPNDPDALTPDGSNGANADLAGVQVQYSAQPTPGDPDPEWMELGYWDSSGDNKWAQYIKGSVSSAQADFSLISDRGFPIICGTDDPTPEHGVLPGGSWRIRCRTFDHGHPYPTMYNPLGIQSGQYTADSFPAFNTSPWSDPINITVPSPVAPPLLLYPTGNIAIQEGTTVRLRWRHRSAFVTTRPQIRRDVQIRKVGDPDWATVFAGPSTDEFADLPPVYVAPPPVPTTEYLTDLGFEDGTLGGWSAYDPFETCDGSQGLVNISNAFLAHSGSRSLWVSYTGTGWPGYQQVVDLNPDHDTFRFKAWVRPPNNATTVTAGLIWLDAAGNPLPDEVQIDPWVESKAASGTAWPQEWMLADTGDLARPAGAEKARLVNYSYDLVSFEMSDFGNGNTRLDDVSFIGSSSTNTDSFTLAATNRYEWRARTCDSEGEWSTYSAAERFWVVPAGASGNVRPIPTETIEGATLGCGTHRVFVYRRGGKERVAEITGCSRVEWNRVRDDVSVSKIEVSDWDVDCGNLLAHLQSWAYEIVIFRDNGYSVDRVWEGPITLLTYERNKVTIQARDVTAYLYRRILKQAMNDSGTGNGTTVTDRAARVIRNAMAPDDPNVLAYLQVIASENDAKQYRSTPAYSRTAFEEVDDMASNAGLDYTAVGRAILLWGTKNRIGTLPEFKDSNFGSPPIVSEYGMSMANRYVVSDGNGVWGEATRLDVSGNDQVYGLVEMLSSTWASDAPEDTGKYTQEGLQTIIESFESSAERSISDRYPPPVVVRVPDNTTLQPETVISIRHLVPGVVIPLRSTATLRTVVQNQKLDSVRVVQENGKETISITLSPFSRDDATAPEEGEQ